MIIDDLTISIEAGRGGDGLVAFNKNKGSLGPTGGSGGNGGNIYFRGISDMGGLNALRNRKIFKAEDGKRGRHQLNDGTAGKDLIILVPVGTVIHNLDTEEDVEITKVGEQILSAKGGRGGRGNFLFRGPHNTSPKQFQKGLSGNIFRIRLELKMIADVGIIGLPNVGKSSLINILTRAKSKVANYNFTTLEPHLGSYFGLILADIPGLIEGASANKGLGIKFLRHIERTKFLFHLISAESKSPVKDYKTVRKELGTYNKNLLEKDEYLFLSKADIGSLTDIEDKIAKLKKLNPKVNILSINNPNSVDRVRNILDDISRGQPML